MSKIHEFQAAKLLAQAGIPTPGGDVAASVEDARRIADGLGFPVVLKAQVLTGGRGKAGGIAVVHDGAQLQKEFGRIRSLTIKDYRVKQVFVVPAADVKKEYYAAVTMDPQARDLVVMASAAGGVDIEEAAQANPDAIRKYYLEGERRPGGSRWKDFLSAVFPGAEDAVGPILEKMIALYVERDCSLVEINPLVLTVAGQWVALDAKINFDENASFRHPEFEELKDEEYADPQEEEAKAAGLSFVKLDGNVGCIVNGAGLAMATLDVIKLSGGEPANFLDVGGSSNPDKVLTAMKIIMTNPDVKVILINIFGGITRCDDIAAGILKARAQMDIPVPLVVRLTGTNEDEARKLLEDAGLAMAADMRSAVQEAVGISVKGKAKKSRGDS